jgi:hypothetical protein
MTIAWIAYQQLTPQVRTEVNRLIRLNPDFSVLSAGATPTEEDLWAFMRAATWPDLIKRDGHHVSDGPDGGNRPPQDGTAGNNIGYSDTAMHKYWHFIDQPFSRDHTPLQPPPDVNAKERIVLLRTTIAGHKPPRMSADDFDRLKSYDLVWLLHLVGDVHQPLHCTSRFNHAQTSGDSGGNLVKIACAGCPVNLHFFWDDILGTSEDPGDAANLGQELDPADPSQASISDPTKWVTESFNLAKADVYHFPVRNGPGPYALTTAYSNKASEVADLQIPLAGQRLANLLNASVH